MRRFVPFILALFALTASADAPVRYSGTHSVAGGSFSASAPSSAPTTISDAFPLNGIKGFRITICAASGQTLSGTGTIQFWLYNPTTGLWSYNKDLDFTVDASSVRCQNTPDYEPSVTAHGFWLFPRPVSVAVGGGATGTVRVDGCNGRCE